MGFVHPEDAVPVASDHLYSVLTPQERQGSQTLRDGLQLRR